MTEQVPWPKPPREPGPWAGGPPVAPPGNTPLPPLPGPGGVSRPSAGGSNPFASIATGAAPGRVAAAGPRPPFPGLLAGPVMPVDRAPRWVVALSALVVLGLVAGGAFVVLKGGRQYPSAWDARVDPIARWVAKERKLSFDHPVEVNFLSEAAYRKVTTRGKSVESEGEDRQAMDDSLAQLRALGLLSGKVDLAKASDTLSDSGTLAFYDPGSEEVYVRGTKLTPALRVTLAHELVHVLQDQHFDLGRMESLAEGQAPVLRALAEGDALRIEDRYGAEALTDDDRAAYEKESAASGDEATEALDDKVPPILTALFASPYIFGPELVAYLDRSGDDDAIDDALRDPPTEEVLFNPLVYGTDAAEPETVKVEPPDGAEALDAGEFGSTAWYLLLASRMEPATALRATDGLGGDAYVVFRDADKVCVRVHARGDAPRDVKELGDALQAWVAKSPAGSARAEVVGDQVEFQSCDPGSDAAGVGQVSVELLQVPVLRTQLHGQVVAAGGTDAQGVCFAEGVIARFTFDQLEDEDYVASPQGQQALTELRAACG